ncbi:MAG: hypothetical protein AB7C97_04960 [Oscillospiraceae bacterium]
MIRIEMEVEELDYNTLIDQYLPVMVEKLRQTNNPVAMLLSNGMPAAMAKSILKSLPQEKKDELTADLINSYNTKIAEKAEDFAKQQNINVSIRQITASIK